MYIDQFEYFTFTCFDCSLEQIENFVLSKWANCEKYKIVHTPFKFDLYKSAPPVGGAHFEKIYFFMAKHHENRCVMFSNYSDGLSSLVYQTTFELKVRAYSFRITKDGVPDVINAFSCIENGTEIRTVYTMKDPRWIFYSQGETQWFEDSELYKCRITKKRLDEKILITYCTRLGFDISNDTFWKSEQSILLERLAW